uniref:Uncharacterized protein n=1 Tax=Trichogramma kaykai TaxID=54128 RepID=A0ABD2XE99_9HYME
MVLRCSSSMRLIGSTRWCAITRGREQWLRYDITRGMNHLASRSREIPHCGAIYTSRGSSSRTRNRMLIINALYIASSSSISNEHNKIRALRTQDWMPIKFSQ